MTKIRLKGTDLELPAAEGPYNLKVYPPECLRKVLRNFRQRLKENRKISFNGNAGYDRRDFGSALV
jgi:hypothetical protein